ncbi:MAG: Rpn family recombination-promoting nuclease/putative transposase [Phormidesmis sp.]
MRRDSIFYKLFQRSPSVLFQLIPDPPQNTEGYRFDSVAVKEPRFEIDGVILPPEGEIGPVFFIEVQFQKDERLYERVLAESALYFYRNRERFSDWQAVTLYPTRSIEQSDLYPHRRLLESGQIRRVFLDELGEIQQLPLEVGLMVLTMIDQERAPAEARQLLARANESAQLSERRAIIDMIVTIISYQFGQMNRQEVEQMLDISFEETRVYKEIRAEAMATGRAEGRAEGEARGEARIILRLLEKRLGELPDTLRAKISNLSLPELDTLGNELLDFESLAEVESWLEE